MRLRAWASRWRVPLAFGFVVAVAALMVALLAAQVGKNTEFERRVTAIANASCADRLRLWDTADAMKTEFTKVISPVAEDDAAARARIARKVAQEKGVRADLEGLLGQRPTCNPHLNGTLG